MRKRQLILTITSHRCRPRTCTWGTSIDSRCGVLVCDVVMVGGPFTTGSIYPQLWGPMEGQPFNVSLFCFHNMFNNFLKMILFNECNFRFTNTETARTITSVFKSSMKILLFQWSHVSKHLEWKPQVDAWFSRFRVSIKLNILLLC
jgi:hypothetical protein